VSLEKSGESTPVSCTLSAEDLKSRFAEIGALAGRALLSHEQDGRTLRLRYSSDAAEELRRLVEREQQCCAFLEFSLQEKPDAVYLSVTAPIEAGEFAPLLYSHFIEQPPSRERPTTPVADASHPGTRD